MTGHRAARLQRRAQCPECGSLQTVNTDGKLRLHRPWGTSLRVPGDYCSGSRTRIGPARARALSWDWKAQPDLGKLAAIVHEISGGTVFMREIDTGGDFYLLAIGDHEVTDDEALDLRLL